MAAEDDEGPSMVLCLLHYGSGDDGVVDSPKQ